MSALGERLSQLAAPRMALFEALARATGGRSLKPDGPVPATGDDEEILSFAQRRLWFVDQLHPGNTAYNVPLAVRLTGALDVTALHAALQGVVDRHAILRTVYRPDDGEARPEVLADHRVDLPVADLADPADLAEHLHAEGARPFDLATQAPLRAGLVRTAPEQHVLYVTMHHIVTDGWSVRLFFDELGALYGAQVRGEPAPLAPLPVQYADFARWQRARIRGERVEELLAFWHEELAGIEPLDLPTDRPRPAVFDHAGASYLVDLPDALVTRLRVCARDAGATLYMTLLAGFAATLSRWTGQDDITIGGSVAGRDHPAVSDVIGFFVNTVATRVRLDGDPTFHDLIIRARASTLQAYAHQELPFDVLVDALGQARDPSRPPLTSVMFLLDETTDTGPELEGLRTELVDIGASAAKYDLMVNVHDTGDGVRAMVEYPTALFDAATVERLLRHFVTLLDAAVDQPDAKVSALPILPRDEQRTMLHAWNDTAAPLHDGHCLHELFEEQVDRHPGATALACDGIEGGGVRTVTYRELEERANRLAHHLAEAGVGPDATVALCLPRGLDLAVATLAVLKAGGAFVPLDPEYPRNRLAFMVRDAAAPVAVTTSALRDRFEGAPCHVVLLDDDRAVIAASPATRPRGGATERNLGYVIYTSGSTGRPKGIALEHRGVVNNLRDLNRTYAVGPGDAVLALSSPSFDMSVYELLGMLGAGGTLVLPDPTAARDPAHWVDLLSTFGVTVWNSAPALLDLLLDHLEHHGGPRLDRLRLALLGGDWIPVAQPDRLRTFAPDLTFVALGGATEASIHSIALVVDAVDPDWRHLPYGRPMANQRAYILDRQGRPVPAGVSGELHLGGVGLARGYVNQPELTAERFVSLELEPGHGERLYRTGDLARYRADGVIELLGRTDLRIKLNGLRIEPGDVEHALRAHPGVREAVVVAQAPSGARPRLVGYVVPDEHADLDVHALRDAVAGTLPPYAVPSSIVSLERLPVSPNGKIDRRALPDADPGTTDRPGGVPPAEDGLEAGEADPLATRIAVAWCSVLDVDRVGRDDDFFALGGDSFAAVRAVRAIAPDLRVVELFTHATPRALAARMRELERAPASAGHTLVHDLTPDRPAGLTLICFPHGGGDAIAYRPLADHLPPGLRLRAISPPGHDPARPEPLLPLEELAERCATEIARTVDGPFAVYGHCAGVVAALETTRRLEEAGHPPSALYLAAALPEEDPAWSLAIEREITDAALVEHLRSLGGFDGVLDERDLSAVIAMVRHDMVEAARFFLRHPNGFGWTLATPLTCVFSDDDEATAGHRERFRDWLRFATSAEVVTIPEGGHYFAKQAPARLVAELAQRSTPIRQT